MAKARVVYPGWPTQWCLPRRTAAYGRTVWPRGRLVARWDGPSPARPRSARRAAVPSASCVRRAAADGQAAHGWPGQHRPIRPLAATLASSCRMTSPWPATAEHRPPESTSRCTRAASSLCRCAASRPPPRGERRWRGETERSQCERARARACLLTAGVQGRCAAGASNLHWYTAALTLEPDHPRRRSRSQSSSPSPSPGPDPSQVRAAPADGRRTCGTTLGRGTRPALSLFWKRPPRRDATHDRAPFVPPRADQDTSWR